MTVIATMITRHFTAHASDSFITVDRGDGTREVVEDRASKLIRVPACRGAMAYWGLAILGNNWNTKRWLEFRAAQASSHVSPEEYGRTLADDLNAELNRFTFSRAVDRGIGIHFTAYEYIDGYWIPELFLISNWTDTTYAEVRPDGFSVTRETYAALKNLPDRSPEQREPAARKQVHSALHQDAVMFRFNNGDPALFNPVANAILDTFVTLFGRRHLHDPESVETHLSLVRRPVDVVSKLLEDLADPRSRVIGGRPHDLAVSPNGEYRSSSGD